MIRRRRRPREIPFSFDSFLDVVANVCGIIIRLILVVWMGARSYTALQQQGLPLEPPAQVEEIGDSGDEPESPLPPDPLRDEIAEQRRQLAAAEAALLEQMRQLQHTVADEKQTESERATVDERRRVLLAERTAVQRSAAEKTQSAQAVVLSVEEIRARNQKLVDEIKSLQAQPSPKKTVRFRTPVSKPVDAEELMFECRGGRVTYIDMPALVEEAKRELRQKLKDQESAREVSGTVGPVGPFELRYELKRALLDASGWDQSFRLEPVADQRGETLTEAMKAGSEFRQIADGLDKHFAAVTFWVYPDSFPLYRQLRDYLYERDLVVAGRPLPDGTPIASSNRGTRSRGQ
jgi:hypothetical protein